jgi:hypothetical protein
MGCGASKETGLCLPANDKDQSGRTRELSEKKKLYEYEYDRNGKPHHVVPWCKDPLPAGEGMCANVDFMPRISMIGGMVDLYKWEGNLHNYGEKVKGWFANNFKSLDCDAKDTNPYARFGASIYPDNHVLPYTIQQDRWRNDWEWAYQRMNGLVCSHLIGCKKIPDYMRLTEQHVAGLLPQGQTLQSMLAAGRLYIIDHSDMVDCPTHEGRFMCPSTAIFAAFTKDDARPADALAGPALRPIAIQLYPDASKAQVVTPNDEAEYPGLWLATRFHHNVTDYSTQVFFEHCVSTHMINETYWVSMNRNMSDRHPIKAVIKPHMDVTLYMGKLFRDSTYSNSKGSTPVLHACGLDGAWEIMRRRMKRWTFEDMNMHKYFASRGTDKLDGFTYREDAYKHYDAIVDYCTEVIKYVYPNGAESIKSDTELQNFVKALTEGSQLRGVPASVESVEALAHLMAAPIYAGAVKHSLIDNATFDYYGCVPNVSASFYLEPPMLKKRAYTDREIAAGLPPPNESVFLVALALCNYPVHPHHSPLFDSHLGQNEEGWKGYNIPEMKAALDKWKGRLANLTKEITARNKALQPRPYTLLLPEEMSNSVWF